MGFLLLFLFLEFLLCLQVFAPADTQRAGSVGLLSSHSVLGKVALPQDGLGWLILCIFFFSLISEDLKNKDSDFGAKASRLWLAGAISSKKTCPPKVSQAWVTHICMWPCFPGMLETSVSC